MRPQRGCFNIFSLFQHSVLQTNKIVACFITSIPIILLTQESFKFSPWGLVSGLFMVPGGTAGYFAVQSAGLALSQGIWSSLKVLVAFFWGIVVFHEPIKSPAVTVVAVLLLMVGLLGMSYYGASSSSQRSDDDVSLEEPLLLDLEDREVAEESEHCRGGFVSGMTRRNLGILGAVIDGAYGGSVLVPMHFATSGTSNGIAFVGSFSIGCLIVVSGVWLLRYLVCCARTKSLKEGFQCLPSFHLTTVGPFATLAGLLWSAGNISSILSVAMLGEGVGYSIVQSQLLVAGLWGVLWYREVQGTSAILRWFLFACLTVTGIVLISQEHISKVVKPS